MAHARTNGVLLVALGALWVAGAGAHAARAAELVIDSTGDAPDVKPVKCGDSTDFMREGQNPSKPGACKPSGGGADPTPEVTPATTPAATPAVTPEVTPAPATSTPETSPSPTSQASPSPDASATPTPDVSPRPRQ